MTGYDHKALEFSHDADGAVEFLVEVRVTPSNTWGAYDSLAVAPGRRLKHEFPSGYHAHWVRVTANRDCKATAWLTYE